MALPPKKTPPPAAKKAAPPAKTAPAPAKTAAPAKKAPPKPPPVAPPSRQITSHDGSKDLIKRPSIAEMLEEDAGSGLENMSAADLATPRLSIIQKMSPQLDKAEDSYNAEAEEGMIVNSVDGELFSGEIGFLGVVISYRRTHLEWKPKRKGFVADHGSDPAILETAKKDEEFNFILPNGNLIVPTAEYFVFMVNEDTGATDPVMISMSKSHLSESKKLNTMATKLMVETPSGPRRAPFFYRTYRFKTAPKNNDRGSWMGWDITPDVNLEDFMADTGRGEQIYMEARQFKRDVEAGKVKVAPQQATDGLGDNARSTAHEGDDAPM